MDRPGYGLSSKNKKLGYRHFASDIKELAEHLNLTSFYLEGVSGGAPWALATAVALKDNVKGVVLVSPIGPLTPEVYRQTSKVHQRVYSVAKKYPFLMRVNIACISYILKHHPDWYLEKSKAKMSASDLRDIEIEATREILRGIFKRATRKTSFGMYQDVVNQANEYDFQLSGIDCPVVIFQGDDDLSTPAEVGEFYKKSIKRCVLHRIPDAGHLWHFYHMKEIMVRGINEIDGLNDKPKSSEHKVVTTHSG